MNNKAANALYRYFETLYSLNQNLIVLCGIDVSDQTVEQERRVDDVVMAIPRLVPYSFNINTSSYEISKSDGLMKFTDELPYLREDYENILRKHNVCLEKVKKVRNKLEHEMHGARVVASSSGTMSLFTVTYDITNDGIYLCATEMIDLVKDMNIMFAELQKLVILFAREHGYDDYPYYKRLVRYDFSDFNKIYDSNLLQVFGKAILPF